MMRIPGRIPIVIHFSFWVVAGIMGFLFSHSLLGTLVWMGIIFISVLVHELGHALTAALFGQSPRIELVALGGLTYHDGSKLPFIKQFFIVLNGPLFGFGLFLIATGLMQIDSLNQGFIGALLQNFRIVNLYWTILNILPVMPLDGGQLMRVILERIFGIKGFKYSLMVSMLFSFFASLAFFIYGAVLAGAFFFLFAFQSYEAWRRARQIAEPDRDDSLKKEFEQAELDLQAGRKDVALADFQKIRDRAKQGMLYTLATQYLAFLKFEQGKMHEAYELLLSIKSELTIDAQCLLHRAAFEEKNFPLVVELGATCFQTFPTAETALRNAYACASLSQAEPAVGWLQTAIQEGLQNVSEVLADNIFDPIRQDPQFQEFLKSL